MLQGPECSVIRTFPQRNVIFPTKKGGKPETTTNMPPVYVFYASLSAGVYSLSAKPSVGASNMR